MLTGFEDQFGFEDAHAPFEGFQLELWCSYGLLGNIISSLAPQGVCDANSQRFGVSVPFVTSVREHL
jgi:hypothetical protein